MLGRGYRRLQPISVEGDQALIIEGHVHGFMMQPLPLLAPQMLERLGLTARTQKSVTRGVRSPLKFSMR
jgi:hypothetical protein